MNKKIMSLVLVGMLGFGMIGCSKKEEKKIETKGGIDGCFKHTNMILNEEDYENGHRINYIYEDFSALLFNPNIQDESKCISTKGTLMEINNISQEDDKVIIDFNFYDYYGESNPSYNKDHYRPLGLYSHTMEGKNSIDLEINENREQYDTVKQEKHEFIDKYDDSDSYMKYHNIKWEIDLNEFIEGNEVICINVNLEVNRYGNDERTCYLILDLGKNTYDIVSSVYLYEMNVE